MKKKLKKNSGFTLIELLISITIGAVVLTSALGIYAQFVQTKLRIDISRQMQKEVNFALSRLTDRVRNCNIKSGNNEKLSLVNCNPGKDATFIFENKSLKMNGGRLVSKKFSVEEDSEFVVTKSTPETQPKVQIFLNVKSNQDEKVMQKIRTTISSRNINFQ